MRPAQTIKMFAAVTAAALAGLASQAHAAPLDRRVVPADAKFVVSLDMDAARDTAVGKAINEKLAAVPDFRTKIAQVSVVTGMTYPQDLHDVTLYGRAAGDEAVVVVAHAHMDRQRMLTALSTTADHAINRVGAYDVVRWTDNGKTMFGAFHDDGTLVVARSEANVTTALNTIDGRSPATAADGPLSGSTPAATRPAIGPAIGPVEHPMLFMALTDLPALAKDGIDMPGPLQQVDGGCLSVSETGGTVAVRADLTAKTAEGAEQLRTAGEGVRAMMGFAAAGPNGTDDLKQIVALFSRATFSRTDRTVTLDLAIPAETIRASLDKPHFGLRVNEPDGGPATTRPGIKVQVDIKGE